MADSALPKPAQFETKDTRNTLIGYTPSPVPHISRTGEALTDAERKQGDQVVGSPAQGNGIQNSEVADVGGVGTDSGGTQESPAVGGSTETPRSAKRPQS